MSTKSDVLLTVCKNYELLCDVVTKQILETSRRVLETQDRFTLALSGSVTPKGVYTRMASRDYHNEFDWHRFHFFWGDERWVPPDHVKSNYRMVAEALLTRVDIPIENIHFVKTKEGNPETSALHYEEELTSFFGLRKGQMPRFDLMLLGLGIDGHTSSLFPNTSAVAETKRLVVSNDIPDIEEPRVTLTFPVINHAAAVFFLVSGSEKSEILHTVLEGGLRDVMLPAQRVRPKDGSLHWFVDKAAASLLTVSASQMI